MLAYLAFYAGLSVICCTAVWHMLRDRTYDIHVQPVAASVPVITFDTGGLA